MVEYNQKIIKMADEIENAPYLFNDDFELYNTAASCTSCTGCGGKCYGPSCSGPRDKKDSDLGLAKKVIELLEK